MAILDLRCVPRKNIVRYYQVKDEFQESQNELAEFLRTIGVDVLPNVRAGKDQKFRMCIIVTHRFGDYDERETTYFPTGWMVVENPQSYRKFDIMSITDFGASYLTL